MKEFNETRTKLNEIKEKLASLNKEKVTKQS